MCVQFQAREETRNKERESGVSIWVLKEKVRINSSIQSPPIEITRNNSNSISNQKQQ